MGYNIFVNGVRIFIVINLTMFVFNLVIYFWGKSKKADVTIFPIIWTIVSSMFISFFSFALGSDSADVSTTNGLSSEIILFLFFSIFTLAGYAISLMNIDILFTIPGSDEERFYKIRNTVNAVLGFVLVMIGFYITSLGGKYKNRSGQLIESHKIEMSFVAVFFIMVGIMILITAIKRQFFNLSIDKFERMNAKQYFEQNFDWQPGEILPIYDKIIRHGNGILISDLLILFSVFILAFEFLRIFVDNFFFSLMACSILFLVLGGSFYVSYLQVQYIKSYQFRWKYGRITNKETKTIRRTTKYQTDTKTTYIYYYLVTFNFGQTYYIDSGSYNKYIVGKEVFLIATTNTSDDSVAQDLSGLNVEVDAGKCYLYG